MAEGLARPGARERRGFDRRIGGNDLPVMPRYGIAAVNDWAIASNTGASIEVRALVVANVSS